MTTDEVVEASYVHADLAPGVLASTVGYASSDPVERLHRGVPSPWLTFVLSLDGPVVWAEREDALGTAGERRDEVLLAPLHTSATFIRMPRQQAGIQMAVHPLVARRLFGASAAELTQPGATGLDVLGPQAAALRQRLVETPTWSERRNDGDLVAHAQLDWPGGGGVMLGSRRETSGVAPGIASIYVVTDHVDEVHDRVRSAPGVTIARPLDDTDYGSHEFVMTDPEGNFWSFGTYRVNPPERVPPRPALIDGKR